MSKEGLTIYHPEPQPTRVPYPQPIQVNDPFDLRHSRIKLLIENLKKEFEILDWLLISINKAQRQEIREVLQGEYRRISAVLDKTWSFITAEIKDLVNQQPLSRNLVFVLIDNMDLTTNLKTPLLRDKFWLWTEGLKQKAGEMICGKCGFEWISNPATMWRCPRCGQPTIECGRRDKTE